MAVLLSAGAYNEVVPNKKIAYTMDDGRKVIVEFDELGNSTHIKIAFDPEKENSHEVQKGGWQAILENFKKHVEGN